MPYFLKVRFIVSTVCLFLSASFFSLSAELVHLFLSIKPAVSFEGRQSTDIETHLKLSLNFLMSVVSLSYWNIAGGALQAKLSLSHFCMSQSSQRS